MGRRKITIAFLDTNVVIWLFDALHKKFSPKVQETLTQNELLISAMVKLELGFLHEIKRIKHTPDQIINSLSKSIGLKLSEADFSSVVSHATKLGWTRDPFDRIITATAMLEKAPLITSDANIRKHYSKAVW